MYRYAFLTFGGSSNEQGRGSSAVYKSCNTRTTASVSGEEWFILSFKHIFRYQSISSGASPHHLITLSPHHLSTNAKWIQIFASSCVCHPISPAPLCHYCQSSRTPPHQFPRSGVWWVSLPGVIKQRMQVNLPVLELFREHLFDILGGLVVVCQHVQGDRAVWQCRVSCPQAFVVDIIAIMFWLLFPAWGSLPSNQACVYKPLLR